jgi:hypothetical protein
VANTAASNRFGSTHRASIALTAGAVLLTVSTLATAGSKDPATATPYDFSIEPSSQAKDYVEVIRGGSFKKIKKLAIVNFSVEFALVKQATVVTTTSDTTKSTTVTMQIPAPDATELQAIVDGYYQDVQADFKAMGIELVPYEELKATKSYEKLEKAQHASPWATTMKDAYSVFVAPTGMPVYLDNVGRADLIKQLGFTFGTNTRMAEVKMTYDIPGGIYLVSVNSVVDFAAPKTSKGKVQTNDVLHLQAENTSYRFVSNTQPELMYVKLERPIVSDAVLWSGLDSETTKTSDLDSKTKTTTSTGMFDAAAYYKQSREMLAAARKMFAAELAAQK